MSQQKGVLALINDEGPEAFKNKDVFLAPNIPDRKLNGAIKGIAGDTVKPEQVYLVYDMTIFGGAGEGVLLTKDTFYYKEMLEDRWSIAYRDLLEARYDCTVKTDKNGKESKKEFLRLTGRDDRHWTIYVPSGIDYEKLADLLTKLSKASVRASEAASGEGEQETKLERKPLDAMPIEVRMAYLKVVMNSMLADDGLIDEKEFSQLYALISRLGLSGEQRFELLLYQTNIEDTQKLVGEMVAPLDELATREVVFSLAKDLLYIHMQTKENAEDATKSPFIAEFAQKNGISEEQLGLFVEVIRNDLKIFDDDADDSTLENGIRSIAAASATVGVPLAALYVSGSVVGLSAAGISSGLATLGLGGLFGISGMVTGIGAVILLGIGAKKGVEFLTGQDEVDRRKRKEALLLAVTSQLQKTVNTLMEDINIFTARLAECLEQASRQAARNAKLEEDMRKLVERIRTMARSGMALSRESDVAEYAAWRQRIPHELNIERLRVVTQEPTSRKYRDEILRLYESKLKKDGDEEEKVIYVLRKDITKDEAEFLAKGLEQLDYFAVSTLAKQSVQTISKLFKK